MAEFCSACNYEMFDMESDFKGLTTEEEWVEDKAALVICEGCGPIQVNPNGDCVSKDCLHTGQDGHGVEKGKETHYEVHHQRFRHKK